ncbi:MAG TPA: metalloregulator ArsR/SmtB family transcription factor [Polyangia bacterium]|nr:metalloregulator ArsR/SmtB family transcription factor [Polyangia bacterium]
MRPTQENDVFHAIAHPARRAILVTLKSGERTASELAAPFDSTFAAISQHLRVLQEADLVSVRREGRQRFYRLDPRPIEDVVTWVDEFAAFFERRLDALGDYLDRKHGKPRVPRRSRPRRGDQ